MIINIFSTHRTGSTWWAKYQWHLNSPAEFYNEIFNIKKYKLPFGNGTVLLDNYDKGCYWAGLNKDETGIVFHHRELEDKDSDRFAKSIAFLKNTPKKFVCHTHIDPLPYPEIIKELADAGTKNFVVKRNNVLEQLASWVITRFDRSFAVYNKENALKTEKFEGSIIKIKSAENLIESILYMDTIIPQIKNAEIVEYENMPFHLEIPGLPLKQSKSAFDRLIKEDQDMLIELCNKHGLKYGK